MMLGYHPVIYALKKALAYSPQWDLLEPEHCYLMIERVPDMTREWKLGFPSSE